MKLQRDQSKELRKEGIVMLVCLPFNKYQCPTQTHNFVNFTSIFKSLFILNQLIDQIECPTLINIKDFKKDVNIYSIILMSSVALESTKKQ